LKIGNCGEGDGSGMLELTRPHCLA
jgi:hypothetical protein